MPVIVALAVAAVILIGGGAGQDRQSTAQDEPAGQEPRPVTEEAGQTRSTEQPSPEEQPSEEPPPEGGEQASQSEDQAPEDPGGDEGLSSPALGDEGAPVVMVEYSDYQ